MDSHTASSYVMAIRNRDKRLYAAAVLRWIWAGRVGPTPEPPVNLSVMAAQAVRMHLEDFRPVKGQEGG